MSTLGPDTIPIELPKAKKPKSKDKKKKKKGEAASGPSSASATPPTAVQNSSAAKAHKAEKKAAQRRSRSSDRTRSRIRHSPLDDAVAFSKVKRRISPTKEEGPHKVRAIVIHGDPKKPNEILPGGKWDEDDFESLDLLKKALEKLSDTHEFRFFCNHDTMIDDLRKAVKDKSADLVVQFCDDGYMNHPRMELHVTALLEIIGLPYTGTGPVAMGMTYDKQIVLSIARDLGIPTPKSILLEEDSRATELIKEHHLDFPVFIKPNHTDGSYGITTKSICRQESDIAEAIHVIRDTFFVQGALLIQEFLEGTDLNTAIIGNPPGQHIFLPTTEEDFSVIPADMPRILGFEAKWDEHSPYFRVSTIPVKSVSEETITAMNNWSAMLFSRIGLRDYARFDWKLGRDGKPRLLEANPNCGWSYDAHLQRMSALGGISYSAMLKLIVESCQQRILAHSNQAKKERFVKVEDVSAVREESKQSSANFQGDLKL